MIANVAPSRTRTAALGKYLVKLATSIQLPSSAAGNATYSDTLDPRRARQVPAERNGSLRKWYAAADTHSQSLQDIDRCVARLAILFLLDATFFALRQPQQNNRDAPSLADFAHEMKPHLTDLIRLAAPLRGKAGLDLHRAIRSILSSWKDDKIYDQSDYLRIREPARDAYRDWLEWLRNESPHAHKQLQKRSKIESTANPEGPRLHGRPEDPWYHLPVGSMLPLIKGRRPIPTARMKPIALPNGPIDQEMLSLVMAHVESANSIFAMPKSGSYSDDSDVQLNGLGLRMIKDPVSGKRKLAETYYGYSPKYAEKLKRRKKNPPTMLRKQAPAAPSNAPVFANATPPPPPVVRSSPGSQISDLPPPLPLPFQIPPKPPNWQGPWPPMPPPPVGGMAVPPPFMPPMGPSNGGYGQSHGEDYGRAGNPRDSRDGFQRGGGGYSERGGYGR